MNKTNSAGIISLAFVAAAAYSQPTYQEYYNKSISTVYSAGTSTCVLFQLTGVTSAHPNATGPWFAVEKTDKESYALLLSARLARVPLNRVLADGSLACGVARAHVIEL